VEANNKIDIINIISVVSIIGIIIVINNEIVGINSNKLYVTLLEKLWFTSKIWCGTELFK